MPTYTGKEITLNKNGNNAKIKVNILPDSEMREIGFTDYREGVWYFHKSLSVNDISFNLTINKKTKEFCIDVLDEDFLQPYDYQYFLEKYKSNKTAEKVQEDVEKIMAFLKDKGIVENHEYGEYI